VRTLVVSDFHIGRGGRRAVLERPAARHRLISALEGVDRLVLLGDIVELLERPVREALAAAEPLLRAVGAKLGAGREVVLVPGNHDRALIAQWLRDRREPLDVDTEVPADASPALRRIAEWLGPARVRVRYPGVWLADGVFATHGHYLDRHLLPASNYGLTRGLLGRPPVDETRPDEYEHGSQSRLSGIQKRLPGPLRWPLRQALGVVRAATMPAAPTNLVTPRWAPLTAPVLSFQMQHASIPALAHVTARLGVEADAVIFGHVHRLGPLEQDDPGDWQAPTGAPALFNTGSWLYEPLLLHGAQPPHPYWPGGAIIVDDGRPPRAVGLLDGLDARQLRRGGSGRRRRSR
jgi:predicted phosphodiesterase